MRGVGVLRRWFAAIVMVVPLAAMSLPALASEADFSETRDAWAQNREDLADTTAGLEALDAATAQATAEYEAVQARLEVAHERLVRLRGLLAEAVRRQRAADAPTTTRSAACWRSCAASRRFTKRVEALQKQSEALIEELRKYQYVGGAPGSKDLWWPTDGGVTSNFGYRAHPIFKTKRLHAGIDIPAPSGQPIFAAAAGRVIGAGPYGGYGNAVVIDHGAGLSTVYAHQSRLGTSVGKTMEAGDTIGYVGSPGYSTGPHLHFEVRTGGQPVDPLAWY